MITMALTLAAVLIPIQLFFGHLNGTAVNDNQPMKLAAIEARWQTEQPASLVVIAWPDEEEEHNLYAITIPDIGGLIDADDYDAMMPGLTTFPKEDRPPVAIPFFSFRIMVGMGLIMLGVSWFAMYLRLRGKLHTTPWFQFITLLATPDRLDRGLDRLVRGRGGGANPGRSITTCG